MWSTKFGLLCQLFLALHTQGHQRLALSCRGSSSFKLWFSKPLDDASLLSASS
jgi:hypothetical protein